MRKEKYNLEDDVELLSAFMYMPVHDIFETFKNKCKNTGWRHFWPKEDYASLFIPGKRKDRVLLVAHVDTVWNDTPLINIDYNDGVFQSKSRFNGLSKKSKCPISGGYGIGADDRAGVAALYKLTNSGHSILLTGLEEKGCIGAFNLSNSNKFRECLYEHSFAIELDRRGKNDAVFYDVGTEEFINYVTKETGYKERDGSYSDIAVLCERGGYCGVNLSIGYKNEHSPWELLSLEWWQNTVNIVKNWISKDNLPTFKI